MPCTTHRLPPYARPEVGGRRCRQPGQVRKEAATTISCRVVGFHLHFLTVPQSAMIPLGAMSDFDFLFSFFGLIAGLTVVEVATRFADAVDAHKRRPMGVLTPLLAVFVLFDVTSFWIAVWSARAVIRVGWGTVFGALAMAVIYFLAAALVFPRGQSDVQDLNEHYWARKRLVISGILLVNVVVVTLEFSRVR